MTIGERWENTGGRPSGFDYIRIALATSVLLWHSYQVSYGTDAARDFWIKSPIGLLLQLILPMFFALSGFLVAGSMYRNPDLATFLKLRVIRIFPALCVDVLFAALVIGPVMTVFPLHEYFASPIFLVYITNIVGNVHYLLPGVFLNNPLPGYVNSQLWTVPFELECYLFITVCAIGGFFRWRATVLPWFAGSTLALAAWNISSGEIVAPAGGFSGRLLVLCFLAGAVIYAYRDKIVWRLEWAIVSFLAALILPRTIDVASYFVPMFAAYLVVYIGLLNPRRTIVVSSGDYSYGLYLYSCPIQQVVAQMLGDKGSWAANIAVALPVTIGFALLSWWLVEKPLLKTRKFLVRAKKAPKRALSIARV